MKIALLTLSFPPEKGGVQTYLREIFARVAQKHSVTIITPIKGRRRIAISNGRFHNFYTALRQAKPDKVVLGHAHPQLLIAAKLFGKPYATLTYGNDYLAAQLRWHRPFFNQLLKQSSQLITITEANRKKLKAILDIDNIQLVYPGTSSLKFLPAKSYSTDLKILTVGRLVPRKGVDMVLRALPAILKSCPKAHYMIVGDGPYRGALEQLARELNITSQVSFTGRVTDSELFSYYQQSSLFVMPSREEAAVGSIEGFGIVYLEAAACGLPVIAGRSGGAVEALREGETGLLVDPHNPQAIATAVLDLLHNPKKAAAMGAAGCRWVKAEMSWDHAAAKIIEMLEA